MDLSLSINGFEVPAHFDDDAVRTLLIPLLSHLGRLREGMDRPLIAFLAAPPAAGKSSLAAFLAHLSRNTPGLVPAQALGMDGFHYHQDYILSHTVIRDGIEIPMCQIKGTPESFDTVRLHEKLVLAQKGRCLWPFYDRRIHDVVEDAVTVDAPILLVEGNWLLLGDPEWTRLPRDFSIFLRAEESMLRERLIARKMRGGMDRAGAEAFYLNSDRANVRRCLAESLPADRTLTMTGDGAYTKGN